MPASLQSWGTPHVNALQAPSQGRGPRCGPYCRICWRALCACARTCTRVRVHQGLGCVRPSSWAYFCVSVRAHASLRACAYVYVPAAPAWSPVGLKDRETQPPAGKGASGGNSPGADGRLGGWGIAGVLGAKGAPAGGMCRERRGPRRVRRRRGRGVGQPAGGEPCVGAWEAKAELSFGMKWRGL